MALQLIKPFEPCGAHSFLNGADTATSNEPCTCGPAKPDGSREIFIGDPLFPPPSSVLLGANALTPLQSIGEDKH